METAKALRSHSRSPSASRQGNSINTRRTFLVATATWSVLAWTGAVRAQTPAKVRRIGLLSQFSPSDAVLLHQAFRLGLRDHGWVEGKNISIEYRYAEGSRGRLLELAADLVRLKVDVIVTSGSPAAVDARRATKAIPIVMATASDPVVMGLIESLARPGGNVTGLSQMAPDLAGRRLQMLKEMVPKLSQVAVIWNPRSRASKLTWQELQLAAQQLGVQLHPLEVHSPNDFDKTIEHAINARVGGLFIIANPVVTTNLKQIAGLAARSRLPSIFQFSEFADAGGLMSYGPDRADMFRRAATFVDKILKGAKPADLPVEQPTKFELVVNMKTAKALGITVPQTILVQANRLIE